MPRTDAEFAESRKALLREVGAAAIADCARRYHLTSREVVVEPTCVDVAAYMQAILADRGVAVETRCVERLPAVRSFMHVVVYDPQVGLYGDAAWKSFQSELVSAYALDGELRDRCPNEPDTLVGTLAEMQTRAASLPVERAYRDFWSASSVARQS